MYSLDALVIKTLKKTGEELHFELLQLPSHDFSFESFLNHRKNFWIMLLIG